MTSQNLAQAWKQPIAKPSMDFMTMAWALSSTIMSHRKLTPIL